jgi:predicted Fe-S protein YdhL (DUF1289 family)
METVMLQVPESQVVEWVKQMSPDAKQAIIKALLPELDRLELLVDYGEARMREICRQRGLDWNSLSEAERQAFIDTLFHES